MSTLLSSLKWMKEEGGERVGKVKLKRIALATTVYYIWMAMNMNIFQGLKPQVDFIVRRIKTQVYKVTLYSYILI